MSDGPSAFEALATSRRSIRQFSDQPLELELVDRLLSVASRAPSAHNRQPWRFAVLTSPEAKDRLARAMGERLRRERLQDGDAPHEVKADVEKSYTRITRAPVVVLLCLTMEDMDDYPDERRSMAEYQMAVQGVAMAGQNLLLAAHAHGLGGCWMCGPLFAKGEARRALDLADAWEPQGAILLGWPAGLPKDRGRQPVDEVSVFL
jgi:F420 biosynthesis protein FbiB-like protein